MALKGFAQGELMPFLPGESSSFPEGFAVLPAGAAVPGPTAGVGKCLN